MLDAQDKSYFNKLVFALVCGVVVVGGLVLAGFQRYFRMDLKESVNQLSSLINRKPNDTPVVLIGDSLVLKSPHGDWSEVKPGTEYTVVLDTPAMRVARKKNWDNESGNDFPDGDDSNPKSDMDSQSLPTSWTINLYTANSNQPAVVVASYGNEIDVTKGTGYLCADSKRRIHYGTVADCSDNIKFTSVEITAGGPPIKEDCVDQTYHAGKCKFVVVE